jgi:pimeloyl-ACP methyl ester carboxylesterase/DNA-binding CsgD family transcriptional regulator
VDALRQQLRFVPVASGARIAWASVGRGPTLVRAAHWLTHVEHDAHSPIFRPWLVQLSRSLRLVRYDARGCGLSESDAVPPGLEASVEELAAVVDATGLPKVALLGLSAGASTAIAYAARHPQRVSRLAICGGYARGLLRRETTDEQRRYFEASAQLIELGWGRRHPEVLQLFTSRMIPEASLEQVRSLNDLQRVSCKAERAAAIYRAAATLDVDALLGAVRCPTLVMHIEGDATVPLDEGRRIAAGIRGARFELLPGSNHIPLAGDPAFARFCQAITDFVREADPAQTPAAGPSLTERERQLTDLVARGLDNQQIGARMGIAEKTVRNALSRLYAKLGVEGRAQAIVRARESGFGAD